MYFVRFTRYCPLAAVQVSFLALKLSDRELAFDPGNRIQVASISITTYTRTLFKKYFGRAIPRVGVGVSKIFGNLGWMRESRVLLTFR
jgi:hypothetical protein